jgi:hypothetical protein
MATLTAPAIDATNSRQPWTTFVERFYQAHRIELTW